MMEKGFIFDYSKCVACHSCVVACYNQNHTSPPISWRQVISGNTSKIPLKGFINLSMACYHCVDAPCLSNCPTIAYSRDEITGAVIHNGNTCIGCRYCTWACPYDAPKYNPNKGVIEKCNFCVDLLKEGGIPACTQACPTGALSFGSIEIEPTHDAPGFPEKQTYPKISISGESVYQNIPEMDLNLYDQHHTYYLQKVKSNIKAKEEFPLIIFTTLVAFLSGWFTASFSKPDAIKWTDAVIFIIGLTLAGVSSLLHLGKPFRAYRSILHVKSSWLSREILFFSLFSTFSIAYMVTHIKVIYWTIVLISVALLISIEMIYSVVKRRYSAPFHSANVVLTYMALVSILILPTVSVTFLVIKAILYFIRHANAHQDIISNKTVLAAFFRIIIGIGVPLTVILLGKVSVDIYILLSSILIGEFIDRFEYYNDIDTFSPHQTI